MWQCAVLYIGGRWKYAHQSEARHFKSNLRGAARLSGVREKAVNSVMSMVALAVGLQQSSINHLCGGQVCFGQVRGLYCLPLTIHSRNVLHAFRAQFERARISNVCSKTDMRHVRSFPSQNPVV